jgi:hypothetical protein
VAPAIVAHGQEREGLTIGLTEVPASRQDDPRALAYIIDHVRGAATFERSFEVSNDTDEPVEVDLYATAAAIRDGSFLLSDGRGANHLTSWMRVEPAHVSLPPRTATAGTVTFDVPADAEEGEHYAAVMAEVAPDARPGQAIAVGRRVGIRVYLSVGDGAEPASDFEIDTLRPGRDDDGRPVVTASVRNTGGRALDMRGELHLSDGPGGTRAGPFPASLGTTLAPGDTERVTVALDDDLPDGPWVARLTLVSGTLERTVEATITFPSEAGTNADPVEADPVEGKRRILIPLAAALLAMVLAALALHARRVRKRRRRTS